MNAELVLLVAAGIAAAAFVLQCLAVRSVSRHMESAARKFEQRAEDLGNQLGQVAANVREVVDSLKPLGRIVEDIQRNSAYLAQLVRKRAEDFDRLADELTQAARDQASKIDYVVTDTVQKFEQVTEVIQKDVINPALEISSFIKGVKSGLAYLFSRKSWRPSEGQAEEELFI